MINRRERIDPRDILPISALNEAYCLWREQVERSISRMVNVIAGTQTEAIPLSGGTGILPVIKV
jgi:hypothetical protein